MADISPQRDDHGDNPLHVVFLDNISHLTCLLLQEKDGTMIYRKNAGVWWYWRDATEEEVTNILAVVLGEE